MQFSSPIVTLRKIIKIQSFSLLRKIPRFKNILAYAREFPSSEIFQNSQAERKYISICIFKIHIYRYHYFERVRSVISQVSILIVSDKESRHTQAHTILSKRIEWLLEHRIKNTNASNSILLSHNFSHDKCIIITLLTISFTIYIFRYTLQDETTIPLSQDCPNFTIKKYPFLNERSIELSLWKEKKRSSFQINRLTIESPSKIMRKCHR